jgi:hypothetical protein
MRLLTSPWLSVRSHVTIQQQQNGFSRNLILRTFTKKCQHITDLVKIGEQRTVHIQVHAFLRAEVTGCGIPPRGIPCDESPSGELLCRLQTSNSGERSRIAALYIRFLTCVERQVGSSPTCFISGYDVSGLLHDLYYHCCSRRVCNLPVCCRFLSGTL